MFLAAALKIAEGPSWPANHFAQGCFLVHARNLAEFFRQGAREFKDNPGRVILREKERDNIYAVDLCARVEWDDKPFHEDSPLVRAINKTLSHLTYSRDHASGTRQIDRFDGSAHVHGTVQLFYQTWTRFIASLKPGHQEKIERWIAEHWTRSDKMAEALSEFEKIVNRRVTEGEQGWAINQLPGRASSRPTL